MILTLSGHQTYTIEFVPAGNDHWEVRKPDQNTWHGCNDAALAWMLGNFRKLADRTDRQAENDRLRCNYGPFRCRSNFLCTNKRHRNQQAYIILSRWQRDQEPIGQMSLFAPEQTHRHVWRHPNGNTSYEAARPGSTIGGEVYCQEMIIALLLMHRKLHPDVPYWRIIPAKDNLPGREWLLEMQNKHAGKIPACVFDEWGAF